MDMDNSARTVILRVADDDPAPSSSGFEFDFEGVGRNRQRGHTPVRNHLVLPHQSPYWNAPCCIQCSYSSYGPSALWLPHSCYLKYKRDTHKKKNEGTLSNSYGV